MAHGHMTSSGHGQTICFTRLKGNPTPLNEPLISKPIQRSQNLGLEIDIKILKFPTIEDGLPEGCENLDFITSQNMGWDMLTKFFTATALFREPLEQLLSDCRPECLVADMFFPWATDAAAKFGIPRLVFHGTSFFALWLEFIWVVRRNKSSEEEDKEDWLPEGFEERIGERGLIIRGWAPQLLILDHEAVGGFVTHCGWNSILEGITSGVPMVTWPAAAEQFYNEKLVTQILKIGIGVGAQQWNMYGHGIMSESIEKAVTQIMKGSEAEEMRRKAKALSKMARMAVEEGGSSCSHLNALTEELIFNLH
ncbi:hypothetical protein GH714_033727 [Hevea brasiliensis]|uniref:anthocyanidin 3-O-glucosyltransferase n=1 Tax=Hevea brasiliensis TaxID=3981 RepID=A0A6A6N8B8_HEVBR|nr:hypothetical protein GH714_033727 [Hevea brasiliensis]